MERTTENVVGKWKCVEIEGNAIPSREGEIVYEFFPDRTWLLSVRSRKNGLDQSSGKYSVEDGKLHLDRVEDAENERLSWSIDISSLTRSTLTTDSKTSNRSIHRYIRVREVAP